MTGSIVGESHVIREGEAFKTFSVGFESPNDRLGDRNHRFWLRCTLPHSVLSGSTAKSLIVMINGLGEADITPYDEIAVELVRHDLATLVLPLPNHFCRSAEGYPESVQFRQGPEQDPFLLDLPDESSVTDVFDEILTSVRSRLKGDPSVWIEGFEQAMADIFRLVELVTGRRPDPNGFFGTNFDEHTQVSIYGYSLGGLIALSAMLAKPRLFGSCFVVNSGSSLEEIDATRFFQRDWNSLQLAIANHFRFLRSVPNRKPLDYEQEFEQVFLGNWSRIRQERLRNLCRRILFVLGATDDMFEVQKVMDLARRDTGIALFQLPVIGHFISANQRHKAEWDSWRSFLARLLSSFEKNHPPDNPLEFALDTTHERLRELSSSERFRGKILVHDENSRSLVPVAVTRNALDTWSGEREFVTGCGYCWEVFRAGERGETQATFADFSILSPGKYGYTASEITRLQNEEGIGMVCGAPIVTVNPDRNERKCVGVVAFASNRAPRKSELRVDPGKVKVEACATAVAGVVQRRGGIASILERRAAEAQTQ